MNYKFISFVETKQKNKKTLFLSNEKLHNRKSLHFLKFWSIFNPMLPKVAKLDATTTCLIEEE